MRLSSIQRAFYRPLMMAMSVLIVPAHSSAQGPEDPFYCERTASVIDFPANDISLAPSVLPCSPQSQAVPRPCTRVLGIPPGTTFRVLPFNALDGHSHTDEGRPTGQLERDGGVFVRYTAPEVSGVIELTFPNGRVFRIGVGLGKPDLVALPASGEGYTTLGSSTGHGASHRFATPDVVARLQKIAVDFQQVYGAGDEMPMPTLVYISLSLPMGGVFDVDANEDGLIDNPWRPPHCSHRLGVDVDLRIRDIPDKLRVELEQVISQNGFRFPVLNESPANPDATHWHLRKK